jgi:alpha/beta superfamily hydrolase
VATIRAISILPARREALTLETADGLSLVAELAQPLDTAPVATMVCLHPLPTHGGMMDSHLFRKASYRLPALAGLAVLRFNTRGTASLQGTSDGSFDSARGERHDVAAAIEYAEFSDLPDIWLVGWSFGSDLALMYGCDPSVRGAVLLSPPLRYARDEHLDSWAAAGKPLLAVVPERDDYLRPRRRPPALRPGAVGRGGRGSRRPAPMGGGRRTRARRDRRPDRSAVQVPLPRTWDGPMECADGMAYAQRA